MSTSRRVWNAARAFLDRDRRYRELALVGDGSGWVLDHEASQIGSIMRRAGVEATELRRPWPFQVAFFASREAALGDAARWRRMRVAVCFPYYHGYPGQGDARFDATYARLKSEHAGVARVQVTHARMRDVVLDSGIAPDKVRTIHIGVDTSAFVVPTPAERIAVRRRLGIPESAVVVGSFQKDGDGWGEGLTPKLIKGPDVLLRALSALQASIPELFVLLSGPARGFVTQGLESANIPYLHQSTLDAHDIPSLFHALDVYLVASREEGGPKAILESMASGVPIVSTRVGQAPELIRHGENGWLVEVGDADGLAHYAREAIRSTDGLTQSRDAARRTAEQHDYRAQSPLWLDFFHGVLSGATP